MSSELENIKASYKNELSLKEKEVRGIDYLLTLDDELRECRF